MLHSVIIYVTGIQDIQSALSLLVVARVGLSGVKGQKRTICKNRIIKKELLK